MAGALVGCTRTSEKAPKPSHLPEPRTTASSEATPAPAEAASTIAANGAEQTPREVQPVAPGPSAAAAETSDLVPAQHRAKPPDTILNLTPCPIARETSWPFQLAQVHQSQLEWNAGRNRDAKSYWRTNAPPWAARIKQTKFVALPAAQMLEPGKFMRIAVGANRAVIVDAAYADASARVGLLPFSSEGPVLDIHEQWLSVPGAHLIQVYPPVGAKGVNELLVWSDEGTLAVRVWSVPRDGHGRASFPCDLALGEEPLWQPYFNCGPEETLQTGQQVTSLTGAIALMKDARVRKFFQLSDRQRIDEAQLAGRAKVRKLGRRTLYEWTDGREQCGSDSHWYRVTSDGWVSQFGCCGK